MSAEMLPPEHVAELINWLARRRAALDPARVVLRDLDGRVVVELPTNGREGAAESDGGGVRVRAMTD